MALFWSLFTLPFKIFKCLNIFIILYNCRYVNISVSHYNLQKYHITFNYLSLFHGPLRRCYFFGVWSQFGVLFQVNIYTEREKIWMKQIRKEERKIKKEAAVQQKTFDPEMLREQR